MRKQIVPILVITLLTAVVWLFAEVESLGEDRPNTRLRFDQVGNPPEALVEAIEFDGNLSLVLRGSRGAIQRAREELDAPIVLRPGDPGVPDIDGTHTVRLKDALDDYEPLKSTGVLIESVRPQRVEIVVSTLVERDIDIVPDLSGIVAEGDATVEPERARVRIPSSLAAELDNLAMIARVPLTSIENTQPGPRTKTVALVLPESIAKEAGVTLITTRATVTFNLRSTIESRTFDTVPVQLLGTSTGFQEWAIEINPQEQLISVELRGPSETLDRLTTDGARLVAVLALSDIELSRGITEKAVGLFVLSDNVPTPLPNGVEPTGALPVVGFAATRLETSAGE